MFFFGRHLPAFWGWLAAAMAAVLWVGALVACQANKPAQPPNRPSFDVIPGTAPSGERSNADVGLTSVGSEKPEDLLMGLPYSVDSSIDSPEKLAATKERFKKVAQSGLRLSDAAPRMFDILQMAALRPGAMVADIGCGTGFLEYAALEHHVPLGKLFALDIDPRALEIVRLVVDEAGYPDGGKIETVLSKSDDMTLPEASLDDILVINLTSLYLPMDDEREAARQIAWIQSAHRALRPDGRLHIIEYSTTFQTGDGKTKVRFLKKNGFKRVGSAPQSGNDFTYMVFVKK